MKLKYEKKMNKRKIVYGLHEDAVHGLEGLAETGTL